MKRNLWTIGVSLAVLCADACVDMHAQSSAIVRQVEAAGSGNLNTYSLPGLAQWFSVRPALATQIANECRVASRHAQADWATSAEGTVCAAATAAAPHQTYTADQRLW